MQNAVKSMMHLLTYTPPADVESIELLEEAQEDAGREPEMAELGGPMAKTKRAAVSIFSRKKTCKKKRGPQQGK